MVIFYYKKMIGAKKMYYVFDDEKKFLNWFRMRTSEGMPKLPITCTIGNPNGAKILEVNYQKNIGLEESHFFRFAFKVENNILQEEIDFIDMKISFTTEITNEQEQKYIEEMFDFFQIHYWGSLENDKVDNILDDLTNEGFKYFGKFQSYYLFYLESEVRLYCYENKYYYVVGKDKDAKTIFSKIRGRQLEKLF
jgi:hypothetical protein